MTSVLILAGARNGSCDLCREAGVASKGLIPIGRMRMIDHVLMALRDARELTGTIWVSGLETRYILENLPKDLEDFGARLREAPAGSGPADAIVQTMQAGADLPLMVTTCDHPLLSPAMIGNFLHQALSAKCDFAVGLAERPIIQSAYPDVKRTYINLGGEGYSGCNLFLIGGQDGKRVVQFWRQAGQDRKQPWKIARRFGYSALFKMLLGRLDVYDAFAHGSAKVGADIKPIIIPIAEAAIDVDKTSDLILVKKLLNATA